MKIAQGYRSRDDGTWGPYSFDYSEPIVLFALIVYQMGWAAVHGQRFRRRP